MSDRRPIKTKISEAIEYWAQRIDESGLSVDWAEAATHCWRCGCEKNLERFHIIPDSLGGKDEPANIVLLCKRCHIDGPNINDSDVMWDWIRAYNVPFYETFWNVLGMKEYEFVYKRSFKEEAMDIFHSAGIVPGKEEYEKVAAFIKESLSETSIHFGHPYLNVSTLAGVLRLTLKKLAKCYGVEFPITEKSEERITPWWAPFLF